MSHFSGQHGFLLACCLFAATLLAPGVARGQPAGPRPRSGLDAERVAAVKAGMVVNFVRYTTWPDSSFEDRDRADPIIVTIVGDGDFDEALTAAAKGQVVAGRTLEIRRLRHPLSDAGADPPPEDDVAAFNDELRRSHVVYFARSEHDRYTQALEALDDSPVLTVSEIAGFAEEGGMLGLAIRERRITFDANENAIKAAVLRVSSQVLKLARIVRRSEEPAKKPREGGGP